MKKNSLLILTALVVALGLFIGLWERHQPTTDEARERAGKVFPSLEAQDIRSLEISSSHGDFRFLRENEKWRLEAPIQTEADQSAVDSVLHSLLKLKVARKLEGDELDPAKYGLKEAAIRVVLTPKSGSTKELLIGSKMPLGSQRAMRLDGGPILLADAWLTSDLEKDLKGWRSHELVSLSLWDLAAITVDEADSRIEAMKIGGKWRLRQPVDDLADEEQLNRLVSGLNAVRILDFVDGDPDPAAMGLDNPRYSLSLSPADGSAAARLAFGLKRKQDGVEQVACRRGDSDYFWVGNSAENALGKAPVLWREARIFPFQSWDALSLKITRDGTTFSIHREEGVWKSESGREADAAKVEERLSAISDLKAKHFDLLLGGRPEFASIQIGLKAPTAEKTEETRITFFKPMEKGGEVLVRVAGRPALMSIDAADAEKILAKIPFPEKTEATPPAEPTPAP